MLSYLLTLLDDPGDEPLMTEMYELYHIKLYKYALSLLHNKQDAEDVTQTTWERVARNFSTAKKYFQEAHKSFFAYIITIARNLSLDEIGRQKRVTDFPENWDAPAPDNTEAQSEHQMLVDMIKSMPVEMRRVLTMQLFEGCSFKEIGKQLGCNEGAAQKRFSRAIEALRKRMG